MNAFVGSSPPPGFDLVVLSVFVVGMAVAALVGDWRSGRRLVRARRVVGADGPGWTSTWARPTPEQVEALEAAGFWDDRSLVFAYGAQGVRLWRPEGAHEILHIAREDIAALRAQDVRDTRHRVRPGLTVVRKDGVQHEFILLTRWGRPLSRAPGRGHEKVAADIGAVLGIPAASPA
ncbi:hypothetical protein J1G44_00105 [Cellulomonas sp. zg-ZUI199]|uniref:Secreted protein n=1 Tax=Cellulomonas wangleii TaxID=2816956 RepID=A0ABX8D1D1_9CELL|nr:MULTISPECIES: hypothetical protein [Cellulomonas]MBO0899836.1 hypothetical protein [Cellulomonas sp. zg-ZUI22]MBO0922885.1 hypothetical protein [Cellulomonas wangleii]QVI61284.1 hypothetical protein KG103_12395 [Cellulomonas wangleii]